MSEPRFVDEAVRAAAGQFQLSGEGEDRLHYAFRHAATRELARHLADGLAGEVREKLARQRAIDAVIHALAQRGTSDPAFRELAGFGRPLPEWAHWLPRDAEDEAAFREEVTDRIEQILDILEETADQQAADERVGGDFYATQPGEGLY